MIGLLISYFYISGMQVGTYAVILDQVASLMNLNIGM